MSEVTLSYPNISTGVHLSILVGRFTCELTTILRSVHRGTLLIRNRLLPVPFSSPMPRGLGWS